MSEYDIVLQLCAPASVDNDLLENQMYEVLGVVEQRAEDIALGPVVAVDYDERIIDLGFNVEAPTLEQSQQRVADVLKLIEQYTDVQFTPTATSSSVVTGDAGHACVA
jgi:hypothetical protein